MAIEGVRPVPVQQPTAVTSAEHTVVVVDEEAQISEPGHGRLQPRPENNTGWLRLLFVHFPLLQQLNWLRLWLCSFVCFTLLQQSDFQGVHPVLQQPLEVEPPEHAERDEAVRILEQGNGPLGFTLLMVRSLVSIALGQNRSNPIWRMNLLTTINLVVAAMIGAAYLPKALDQEAHETYNRVMLPMTVVAPIVVAITTFLASIWIARDRQGRINWITGLSLANVSMLAGPLVLIYWVQSTYSTGK